MMPSEVYQAWIREQMCAVRAYTTSPGLVQCEYWGGYHSEACHIKHRGMGGANAPADEGNLIPLCHKHHYEMHSPGSSVATVLAKYGLVGASADYLEIYQAQRNFV